MKCLNRPFCTRVPPGYPQSVANRKSAVSGRGTCIPLLVLCLAVLPAAAHLDLEIQIANVSEAIAREPENATLYLKRGELYRAHEEWSASESDFLTARKLVRLVVRLLTTNQPFRVRRVDSDDSV